MKAFALAVCLLASSTAQAVEFGGNLRLGADFGGERLVTVRYSDGSESDLRTASYMSITLGGTLIPLRGGIHALQLDAAIGFAGWSTGPDSTEDRLSLNRFPFELLASYRVDIAPATSLRVGGGMTFHMVTGINGSGSLESTQIDMDNAIGGVAEASVLWGVLGFHLRYTPMTYTFAATGGKIDASSFGIAISICYPPAGTGLKPMMPQPGTRPAAM